MVEQHPDVAAGSSNKYQNWEVVDPEKWVPDGYACVRVDSRGAGRSPGYMDPFSDRETRDFYECIEWAGVQPWSNGKVGANGISYYAINQWQVACLKPPHLVAMCAWEGAADFYRDMNYHGGIYCTFTENWYQNRGRSKQHGLGERGYKSRVTGDWVSGPDTLSDEELGANRCNLGAEMRAHPLDDEYWQAKTPDWSKVEVPFLSSNNWGGQGLHPRGNCEAFMRAASRGEMAGEPRHRALDGVLHRLRRGAPEEIFWPLPERRGHGLEGSAQGAAQGAPSRREVRGARGG